MDSSDNEREECRYVFTFLGITISIVAVCISAYQIAALFVKGCN